MINEPTFANLSSTKEFWSAWWRRRASYVGDGRSESGDRPRARFAVSKIMAKSCITIYLYFFSATQRKVLLDGVPERRKSVDKKIGGERTNAVTMSRSKLSIVIALQAEMSSQRNKRSPENCGCQSTISRGMKMKTGVEDAWLTWPRKRANVFRHALAFDALTTIINCCRRGVGQFNPTCNSQAPQIGPFTVIPATTVAIYLTWLMCWNTREPVNIT